MDIPESKMNRIKGTITDIQSYEGISLVKVMTDENLVFTSIVIDTSETADYLKNGHSVFVIFKETEVIIAKGNDLNISVQNKIPCIVKSIETGMLLCEINLQLGKTEINSIITRAGYKQLDLRENEQVIALVKTNEVSLLPYA